MTKRLIIIISICLSIWSCEKENITLTPGEIIGLKIEKLASDSNVNTVDIWKRSTSDGIFYCLYPNKKFEVDKNVINVEGVYFNLENVTYFYLKRNSIEIYFIDEF